MIIMSDLYFIKEKKCLEEIISKNNVIAIDMQILAFNLINRLLSL